MNSSTSPEAQSHLATVERMNARTGSAVLSLADGGHVLAQQMDAKPLQPSLTLSGRWDAMGVETVTAPDGTTYEFFIEAFGLSREAALYEID